MIEWLGTIPDWIAAVMAFWGLKIANDHFNKQPKVSLSEEIKSGEVASVSIIWHHWTEWQKGGTYEHKEKRIKNWKMSPEKVEVARQKALEKY